MINVEDFSPWYFYLWFIPLWLGLMLNSNDVLNYLQVLNHNIKYINSDLKNKNNKVIGFISENGNIIIFDFRSVLDRVVFIVDTVIRVALIILIVYMIIDLRIYINRSLLLTFLIIIAVIALTSIYICFIIIKFNKLKNSRFRKLALICKHESTNKYILETHNSNNYRGCYVDSSAIIRFIYIKYLFTVNYVCFACITIIAFALNTHFKNIIDNTEHVVSYVSYDFNSVLNNIIINSSFTLLSIVVSSIIVRYVEKIMCSVVKKCLIKGW